MTEILLRGASAILAVEADAVDQTAVQCNAAVDQTAAVG
jgi:hypothetical protein